MRHPFRTLLVGGAALLAVPAGAQSLDQTIAAALDHSPALAATRARADAARAQVDEARAERMPQVAVEGEIGIGRIDPQGFFGLTADNVVPRSARATVELPLFTGGRIGAAERQASSGAEAAAFRSRMATLELRVEIVGAYAQAVSSQQLIRQYMRLVESLTEIVRHANLRFQVGEGTSTEIAQAEARRAEAEAGLAGARGQFASAQAQLAALAGAPVTVDPALPNTPPLPLSSSDAVARALVDNPALLAAEQLVEAARAHRDGTRAERMPTIGAFAEAATVRDQFFPGYAADTASVGVRARWTLFDGGRTGARVRRASAELRAAQADADDARLTIEQQAITAMQDVETARALVSAAEARLIATRAALRGTELEVQVGAKPQLALLDAQREAIEADASHAAARGRLLVAAYRLRAIAGID